MITPSIRIRQCTAESCTAWNHSIVIAPLSGHPLVETNILKNKRRDSTAEEASKCIVTNLASEDGLATGSDCIANYASGALTSLTIRSGQPKI